MGSGDGMRDQDFVLPAICARQFYEELFRPDDFMDEPKELLVEILHKIVLQAEGQPLEQRGRCRVILLPIQATGPAAGCRAALKRE